MTLPSSVRGGDGLYEGPGGVTPFAAFIFSPVIGYAGDKVILQDLTSPRPQLGYKPVLVFSVVAALVSGGALSLLPHYTRHLPKVHPTLPPGPQAAVVGFDSSTSPPWESVAWVRHYGACTSSPLLVGVECGGVRWRGEELLGSSCSVGEEGRCGEESTCSYQCPPTVFNASIQFCR